MRFDHRSKSFGLALRAVAYPTGSGLMACHRDNGAGAGNRTRMAEADGFSYHFDFRRRAKRVRGLDYPFTLAVGL